MAIGFVNDLLSKEGGAINKVAAQMSDLRKKSTQVSLILNQADSTLESLSGAVLPQDALTIGEIDTQLNQIKLSVANATSSIADVTGVPDSCLATAMGAIGSLANDAFSVVDDGMAALYALDGIPAEMADLSGKYSKAKDMITSLGISELIALVDTSLGCISDVDVIADVRGELASLTGQLGLADNGAQDPTKYKEMIAGKLAGVPGLDPAYKTYLEDGLSNMAEAASEMGDSAKDVMKSSIASVKSSIPKLPSLPSLW